VVHDLASHVSEHLGRRKTLSDGDDPEHRLIVIRDDQLVPGFLHLPKELEPPGLERSSKQSSRSPHPAFSFLTSAISAGTAVSQVATRP